MDVGAPVASQPARAVWIEILAVFASPTLALRHSLRGLCGLKSHRIRHIPSNFRHSLRGLCGLKFPTECVRIEGYVSQPARAVWIEMIRHIRSVRGIRSQPARAVWIEIWKQRYCYHTRYVTACEGCVD